jgi:hypothetical protein
MRNTVSGTGVTDVGEEGYRIKSINQETVSADPATATRHHPLLFNSSVKHHSHSLTHSLCPHAPPQTFPPFHLTAHWFVSR